MSFFTPLSEAQLDHIKKKDVYRSDAELEEDVTQLMEWLSKQPHLPDVTDRNFLLHFITGCKYSLQKCKQVIESYYTARAELPQFYGYVSEEEFKMQGKTGAYSFLPKLTPEGHQVWCWRSLAAANDDKFNPSLFGKQGVVLLELQLKEVPMYGDIFLYDLKHLRWSDFLTVTPTFVKNMCKCFLLSFPVRVKSINFVNPPMFTNSLVTLIKMFLPSKIEKRLFVHDSLESLHQVIPKDVLPEIYGGTGGNIENYEKKTYELLMKNKEWLAEQPKADLLKLQEHEQSNESNMNGTFRKLQID